MPFVHCLRIAATSLAAAAALAAFRAHPIHTTLTELTSLRTSDSVLVSMRVFADDFGTAAARRARAPLADDWSVPDSVAFAYAAASLAITARNGRAATLAWCGSRREGEVVWLCLRTVVPGGLGGARVLNRALWDLHDDQINIVQANYGGRRHSTIFTRNDPPKPLPLP